MRKGFTLIELLIVVAIIAILAAIAVPNFLEAQTRSKVTRTKADMRTIAMCMETYKLDTNYYPLDWDSGAFGGSFTSEWRTYASLTTPIAYMSSIPEDVFLKGGRNKISGILNTIKEHAYFQYSGGSKTFDRFGISYRMSSPGPNGIDEFLWGNIDFTSNMYNRMYDATNGTKSIGDLARTNTGSFPE